MNYVGRTVLLAGVFWGAYLIAGGIVEQRHAISWVYWPTVELERGLYACRSPLLVQRLFEGRHGFTGEDIAVADRHFDQQPIDLQRWLVAMHSAEKAGLEAAGGADLFLLILWVGLAIRKKRRAKTQARRALARKTSSMPLTAARRKQIELARVPLPGKAEPRGILLCGAPGSGKSQAILAVMQQARERNDTIVALDRGGELLSKLYRPGDVIFCPLDKRDPGWSELAETRNDMDRDTFAEMLFPLRGDGGAADFFQEAAGVVVKTILGACSGLDNAAVWRRLSNNKELMATLRGTEAEEYTKAREWGGIVSNLMNTMQWLKYLPPNHGADSFSIRRFIGESDTMPGRTLWCVIPKSAATTLKPMAALLVGLVAHQALSLPPSDTRRIWLATDELGNLPILSNFSTVLSEGRKHGLCPISGVQSIAQLRKIYGRDGAQELMACYQNWLILRQGDAESAESMSKHIGEREIREWRKTEGSSTGDGRSTSNSGRSEQVRIKRSVLARQLQELPDLQGFLCISPYPPAYVDLPVIELPTSASPFEPVDLVSESATPQSLQSPVSAGVITKHAPFTPMLDLGPLDSDIND